MIIPLGSLLIIISVFICALLVLFYVPYYVGIFILLTFIFLIKLVPNNISYFKSFTSSVVFWFNYYLDVIVAKMLNNVGHKSKNLADIADRQGMYRSVANSAFRDEELQPVDFTVRHRRFDSSDSLVQSSSSKHSRQVANSFFKRNKDNVTNRNDSTSILSPLNYNESDRNFLNTGASLNTVDSTGSGTKVSPTRRVGVLHKFNSYSMSGGRNIGNRTSRFSQTYFELDDGVKENVNVLYSSESSLDSGSVSPLRYKVNTSLHPTQESYQNQHNFYSRRHTGISPGKRHSDSYSGVLTHQSKYAGPGQLPRVCLGRPNLLLTFSGTSLSKCVQSPVRAKPSVSLPKTRAYRLSNDSSPRFTAKFEETSRKRIRNSYEEDEDDAAKRQCKADELTNCDEFEEDSVNLKRAREDSPKSDVDQQSQKSKKRVCNNEFLSSLSSSRNLLHTSARKRKAAVVDWSRSSTPVQEKLFKKSIGSPDIVINNQESVQRLTEEKYSVSQERLQPVVNDGSDKNVTPVATSSPQPKKSVERSQISNYTLFDVPVSLLDTSVQENSTTNIYADLNSSLEAVPKICPEKKTFDTKELDREAISKRLSSFWDAFGSVDVNKARNAMAPQKSSRKLASVSQVATTSAPAIITANSVVTSTLQQPSLPNILEQKEKNVSVNVVDKTDSIRYVATSAESMFTYGQSLSRSRELSSSLNLKNLVDSPAVITSTATTSAEISSDQNKFTISSSPSVPVINGSDVALSTGSSDLQRSKSSVGLVPNLQLTPRVAIASSGLSSTSKEVPSSTVLTPSTQAVATVLTSAPFSSAPTNTTSSITPNKPLFGFTSPLSLNIKTSPAGVKQNSSVLGESKVGGFAFNFNTSAATASDEKNENKSLSSNFSVPQTACSAVSSAHLILNSTSSVITPSQGGFSFPKLTSSSNHVDAPKAPNIFGSSQISSGFGSSQTSSGFGSSQTSSGFGSSQTSSGFGNSQSSSGFGNSQTSSFGNSQTSGFGISQTSSGFANSQTLASGFGNAPTGGLSKVETLPAKFGSVEGTPAQGFGNIQVTSAGVFNNGSLNVPSQITPVNSFGNVPSSSSGFGNVQTTSEGGFSNVQATPKSVFENAHATPIGFGSAPAKSGAEFGSAQSPASSNLFGTSQTATNSTTAAFSFGAPNVQKTTSAFTFGTSTVTTSSADTPVQSSGFGSAVTTAVQPQTSHSQLVLFSGGSNASKTQASTDGTKNDAFVFGVASTTPKPGGFAFGSSTSSQPSTTTSVTFNFGSNAISQAPTITSEKFLFGSPHSQSSGMPTTQPQLSFGSGSGISSQLSQSPFSTPLPQNPTSAATTTQKAGLSFGTSQPSFGIQQMQNSTLAQQPQVPFGNVQPQTSGASSLMQPPQMANMNPLLQSAGQQPSPFGVQAQQPLPFGAQAQQPQGGGGFNFTASMPQQQQAAPSGGLFGASSQTSTFQFGSAPSGTSQSTISGTALGLLREPTVVSVPITDDGSVSGISAALQRSHFLPSSDDATAAASSSSSSSSSSEKCSCQAFSSEVLIWQGCGFSFGNAVSSTSIAPAVNFNAGSNANNLFQVGAPGGFGGSSAGMFSIGSGSTAPRVKLPARNRRNVK